MSLVITLKVDPKPLAWAPFCSFWAPGAGHPASRREVISPPHKKIGNSGQSVASLDPSGLGTQEWG